ncbi:SAM-dependent methyltransferase [Streptomyces sp. NBC_01477]|uniref:SAM-dependent methyltransferase n=1 Tax=Streptomyces sp. NBC_01477 TaxID=2976015 RepID=UPI002E35F20C|nr:SAM-dependent methyltransferase [Streptomyces sp. NBC_01477]
MTGSGTPTGYFDTMYRDADDPWHLTERWYEQRKYDLTVAALPLPRYRRAFEPACSVGELTRRLAPRCDAVLACDRVASAVRTARSRTAEFPQVTVERMTVPDEWPEGTFDLVVLSEVLYYFEPTQLDALLARTVASLEPGGTLVTVHWDHPVPEHRSTGTGVAAVVGATAGLHLVADHREDDFVLQVHQRAGHDGQPPASPAAREGLV